MEGLARDAPGKAASDRGNANNANILTDFCRTHKDARTVVILNSICVVSERGFSAAHAWASFPFGRIAAFRWPPAKRDGQPAPTEATARLRRLVGMSMRRLCAR